MLSLESRLRKLEEQAGPGRIIVVARAESESTDDVLAEAGVIPSDNDMIVTVMRFSLAAGVPWPAHIQRVTIHERAA